MDSDGFVTTPTDDNDHPLGGKHRRYFFPNGYGASVIRHWGSYGYTEGLYELAVLQGNAQKARLTYDTPITDDVIGHLTPADVELLLERIKALPAAQTDILASTPPGEGQ